MFNMYRIHTMPMRCEHNTNYFQTENSNKVKEAEKCVCVCGRRRLKSEQEIEYFLS